MHRRELHGANRGTRGGDRKEGPLNKERGDCVGDGSLQSQSGANLNPKTAKDMVDVPKGGEAGGVALTVSEHVSSSPLAHARRDALVYEDENDVSESAVGSNSQAPPAM
jgi:hypothetical protein